MAIMCSLAVCKAQAGMCGHEKAMLSSRHARGYRPWGLLSDQLTGGLRVKKRSLVSQDAQNGIPARPQGARRLKRTLGVRCRETGD